MWSFPLLFYKAWQRNVPQVIKYAQTIGLLIEHYCFCNVLVAVAVVDVNSLMTAVDTVLTSPTVSKISSSFSFSSPTEDEDKENKINNIGDKDKNMAVATLQS